MSTAKRDRRAGRRANGAAGFTLVEMLIAMAVGTVVMAAMLTGISDALRANESVVMITGANNTVRVAMDQIVRDLLQGGFGLPPGHVIETPSGDGATPVRLPGPPGTAFTMPVGSTEIAAVMPGAALGPAINGSASDIITVIAADNNFTDVALTAVTATSVTVAVGVNVAAGPDRVSVGQLMMITKGSATTLVQVTAVDAALRLLTFAEGDSLNLNQPLAAAGTLAALNATAPANTPANTTITRIRMISYYLDTTIAGHPRLVRRINNGHPTTFDNTLGTAVGPDIERLTFSYDLSDGDTNPSGVRFTAADLDGTGACPDPCGLTQIRKVNVTLTVRSANADQPNARVFRNSLTSQVSLRGMAFVNEYQSP